MIHERGVGIKDDDGCPDKGRAQVAVQGRRIQILQRVLFATGSDRIRPVSFGLLRQVAAVLKKAWWIRRVRVEGHTDSQGSAAYNMTLSEKRAAVRLRMSGSCSSMVGPRRSG